MTTTETRELSQIGTAYRSNVTPAAEAWTVAIERDPARIIPAWQALEARGHATVFQTSSWCLPWYRAAASGGLAEPLVVSVARRGGGSPLLILPLAVTRRHGLATVTFADLGFSDYAAPVLAPDEELSDAEARQALAAALRKLPGDVVSFEKIVPLVGGRNNPLARLAGIAKSPLSAYGLPLEMPFGPQAARAFDKSFHRDLQRVMRKLAAEKGAPRLVVAATRDEATRLFETMLEHRRERFSALGRPDALAEPVWQSFYREVFGGSGAAGQGIVLALEVGGEIVAVDLALIHNDAICLLAGSFLMDETWRKYSLGNVLTYLEMDWAAAQGIGLFDLTVGAESYKLRFGVRELALSDWTAPLSWRGTAVVALSRAKSFVRERPQLHAILRRTLARA